MMKWVVDPEAMQADMDEFSKASAIDLKRMMTLIDQKMVSNRWLVNELFGANEEDVILPYQKAFAELQKRKKSKSYSSHTMTKVNSGQWKVSSTSTIRALEKACTDDIFKGIGK